MKEKKFLAVQQKHDSKNEMKQWWKIFFRIFDHWDNQDGDASIQK